MTDDALERDVDELQLAAILQTRIMPLRSEPSPAQALALAKAVTDAGWAPARVTAYLAGQVRQLEQLAADMLSRFTRTDDGHRARVGQVQIARWSAILRGEPGAVQGPCCELHKPGPANSVPGHTAACLDRINRTSEQCCCGGWQPRAACCDPDDCGPCCEKCPTCPTLLLTHLAGRQAGRMITDGS